MTMDCPTSESLKHYAIGDLDEATSDVIERHLGDCPACEETVARFDSADDTLIRHLPLAAGADARKTTEAPGWLARLRQGPPAGSPNLDSELPPDAWPTSPPDDGSPAELAAYELLGVLGQGGMGVVYRARHRQLRRHVALKVLNPRLMATPEGVRRFEREIQILGGLRHGGIVMATDAGRVRGSAYLVMELVEGIDLSRLVKQSGPLPIPEACEAARQMAEALSAAHEAGTVHRDVKPSNVMIDRHGRIKLLDFGLARLAALSTQSLDTSVGCLLGTLEYMAPEQADSDQPTDPRADYFGLGATLFYLLTGRPPRSGGPRASLLQQLSSLTADAPRVSTIRPDIPAELDEFLARLLDRDPQRRPASAREIADQLNVWAAGGSLASRVENLPAPETEPPTEAEAAAQRSLSELLGHDEAAELASSSTAAAPSPVAADAGRGQRRVWPAVVGGLGGAIALLFGMTIVLQMSDGTLRIESESDNVQVEVVNDKDQVTDLKIDRNGKETKLSAGQYRIRLTGSHDGMVLDNNTVTLTRGKTTVARITREKDISQANGSVFSISGGRSGFTLKEHEYRIVSAKARVKTVDGFDEHLLKVTATEKPNEIRVQALASGTDSSSTLVLVDEHGERFLVDVLVEKRTRVSDNNGSPYLPSTNTGGHLDLAKSASAEGHKVDHVKLEQKLKVLFPNSTVQLIPMSGKIIIKGQAKDSEEEARILSLISGEVINQAGSLVAPQLTSTPVSPNSAATDLIVNMLEGHGDDTGWQAHLAGLKTLSEIPYSRNPRTGTKQVIYYFFDSTKPASQAVTSVIRSLKGEGFVINEVDHSIYRVLPPHLSHIRTIDSPQLCVLEGKKIIQHVAALGGDVNRVRSFLTEVGIVSGAKSEEPTLLFFKAAWCGPSQRMQPGIAKIREAGYSVREIDADANKAEFDSYHIESTPTFVILTNQKEVRRLMGVTPATSLMSLMKVGGTVASLEAKIAARDAALEKWRQVQAENAKGNRERGEEGKKQNAQVRDEYFRLRDEVESLVAASPAMAAEPERVYKGRRELDWWRSFRIETNTELKLEAARALLSLAREMPPPRQIDTTLDVAAELLRVSGNNPPFEAAFRHSEPEVDEELRTPIQHFQRELIQQIRKLPAGALAEYLPDTMLHSPDSQAALAYYLFDAAAYGVIEATPASARTCLQKLQTGAKGDRHTLAILAQAQLIHHGTPDQRNRLVADLTELGKGLSIPPESEFQRRLQRELIGRILPFFNCYECRGRFSEISARLILQDLLNGTHTIDTYFGSQYDAIRYQYRLPYSPEHVARERQLRQYFLKSWVPIVNEYFARRRNGPFGERDRTVAQALNYVLQVQSDGDAWPTDVTAAWLTERLRSYYAADASAADQQGLLPESPLSIQNMIVAIKGEVPDFVLKGPPRSKLLARKLVRFEQVMTGKIDGSQYEEERKAWQGIALESPYELLKLCVTSTTNDKKRGHFFEWLDSASSPSYPFYMRETLLFLTLLQPLTGESEAQDKEIASVFTYRSFSRNLMSQVEDLAGSKLKARAHMRRVLQSLSAKAKAKELVEALRPYVLAIDNQDPGEASRTTTSTAASPAGASATIPPGMRVIPVTVALSERQWSTLKPGDHVDVLFAYQAEEGMLPGTAAEFVEVFAIDEAKENGGPKTSNDNVKFFVLSLLCNRKQATDLREIATNATLQIALRGSVDKAKDAPKSASADKPIGSGASTTIPTGMRLVSIPGNKLRLEKGTVFPGDRVDLIATIPLNPQPPEPTKKISVKPQPDPMLMNAGLVLQDVEVFAIGRERAGPAGPISETLTILCTPDQAQKLQSTLEKASITISLRRGKETIADASNVRPGSKPKADPPPAPPARSVESTPGGGIGGNAVPLRLYQGKSENDWRGIFFAETSPVAKLDAARALLSLASDAPPDKQIDRIIEVVGEVARASYSGNALAFGFEFASRPPTKNMRWATNRAGEVANAYAKWQQELDELITQLPADALVGGLTKALHSRNDHEAAAAYAFLSGAALPLIQKRPETLQRLREQFGLVQASKDRETLKLLIRAHLVGPKLAQGLRDFVYREIDKLVTELRTAPPQNFGEQVKVELLHRIMKRPDWNAVIDKPEIQNSLALNTSRLILDEIKADRLNVSYFQFNRFDREARQLEQPMQTLYVPSDPRYVRLHRRQLQHFLSGWVTVANEWLAEHRQPPFDATTRRVMQTLELLLPLHCDGDNWPVDKTAAIFTDQLRSYYKIDPAKMSYDSVDDLLPISPASLLTQIVRITGKVPDFVKKERPRSWRVVQKMDRFELYLRNRLDERKARDDLAGWKGLLDDTPWEVVNSSLTDPILRPGSLQQSFQLASHSSLASDLMLDSVLLLQLLSEQSGQDAQRDLRIAGYFNDHYKRQSWRGHLDGILEGKTTVRKHVRSMLQGMVNNAKAKELTETLQPFLHSDTDPKAQPQNGSGSAPSNGNAPAQPPAEPAPPGPDSGTLKKRADLQQIQLAEKLQREKEFFKGTWLVESMEINAENLEGVNTRGMKYVFSPDGKVSSTLDKKTTEGSYELDVSRRPYLITFSSKDADGTVKSQAVTYEVHDGKIYIIAKKVRSPLGPKGTTKPSDEILGRVDVTMVLVREK